MKKIIFRLFMLLVCLVSMVVPGKANTVSAYTVSNYRTYVYYMGLTSGGNSLFAVSQKYYTGSGIGNIGKDTGPIKEKSGDLPSLAYFKKMSETWISNNVFTTVDAIRYTTTFEGGKSSENEAPKTKYTTGGFETL